jgi:hypothetical protein
MAPWSVAREKVLCSDAPDAAVALISKAAINAKHRTIFFSKYNIVFSNFANQVTISRFFFFFAVSHDSNLMWNNYAILYVIDTKNRIAKKVTELGRLKRSARAKIGISGR